MQVTVGKDRLQFEAGPYHTIGLSSLTQPGFVCDFTARLKSNNAVLVTIPRKLYLDAVAASKIAHKRVRLHVQPLGCAGRRGREVQEVEG